MTSSAERRKHFADVVSVGREELVRFPAFRSLEHEWNTAISEWRAEEEHAASTKAAEETEAKRLEDQRKSLRARRQSDLLLADDLLQQTHKELDSLLMSASCGAGANHSKADSMRSSQNVNTSSTNNVVASSHTESLLSSTPAPVEVDAFDSRLPRLVPPSYYSKVEAILLQLDGAHNAAKSEAQFKSNAAASTALSTTATKRSSHESPSAAEFPVVMMRLSSQPRDVVSSVLHELSELLETLAPHHWNPVLFHCRAACHYALGNIRLALKDSVKALELCHADYHVSLCTLAYRRMLRCHIVLSDSQASSEVMAQCKSNSSRFGTSVLEALTQEQSLVTSLHQLSESCEHKLWSQALDIASKLCSEVPESPSLAEKRIEILVNTAATAGSDSAKTLNEIASATLKFPLCGGIWYWYGVQQLKHSSNFQDVEAASRSLQRAVSLSGIEGNAAAKQELQKVRYLESKAAMATAYQKSKRWRQAVAELTMLLTLNGVSKGLKRMFTCMRAKAFMALDRWMECMSDATYLLNHATTDDEVVEAYILRAEAFLLGRNREAAIRDARCASGVLPGHSVAAALLRQLEMDANKNNGHDTYRPPTPPPQRKSSSSRAVPPEGAPSPPPPPPAGGHMPSPPPRGRPDSAASARSVPAVVPPHYTSLNVSVSATSAVITKSYREAALKWHPDRWTSAPANDVLVAEEVFKKLNTAYHTLTDDALRLAYDREHGVRR